MRALVFAGASTMDRHYFSDKGAKAEKVIHDLALKSFFADWCYLNPPKPEGNEICDLLVVFDDIAIIWQIKDLKADEHGMYDQSEVDKNIRQVSGAWRRLFAMEGLVTLTNLRRGKTVFDPKSIRETHLISVLMGEGTAPMPLMDTVKNQQVHIFTRNFADIVLSELDTIVDFQRYLNAKQNLSEIGFLLVSGEENLLAEYLYSGKSFTRLQGFDAVHIDDTIWDAFQSKPECMRKREEDRISRGWDSIIDRAHEGSSNYEVVARELARPDRFERRILSKTFSEAYGELKMKGLSAIRRVTVVGNTTYCFLITSDDPIASEKRKERLGMSCFVARGVFPDKARVIGVSTTLANRSYDFVFLNMPNWSEADERRMKKIQEDTGIFVSPRQSAYGEDEYPER
jgi:hypothetical protein